MRRNLSETGAQARLNTVCQAYPTCIVFYGVYGGMVSILPYGMVWYVSKHKRKDNLGTFGSVVERLEVLWKRLNAIRALGERMGAFGRLGRLGRLEP